MNIPTIVWLSIFVVLVLTELATMGLTTVWFAGGAIVSCIMAAILLPIWMQIIAFVIVSGVLLYFTRPIAVKYFNRNRVKTNIDEKIGKQAIVTSDIDNLQGSGQVKIDGMEWSARSLNGEVILSGSVVRVVKISGVKLIVETDK